jgi:hypothetical protein
MSSWHNVFVVIPADGAAVWIVRVPYFDTPVQATWHEGTAVFSWLDSLGHSHDLVVAAVWKWRLV